VLGDCACGTWRMAVIAEHACFPNRCLNVSSCAAPAFGRSSLFTATCHLRTYPRCGSSMYCPQCSAGDESYSSRALYLRLVWCSAPTCFRGAAVCTGHSEARFELPQAVSCVVAAIAPQAGSAGTSLPCLRLRGCHCTPADIPGAHAA
jgi:hypothetical protein